MQVDRFSDNAPHYKRARSSQADRTIVLQQFFCHVISFVYISDLYSQAVRKLNKQSLAQVYKYFNYHNNLTPFASRWLK